MLRRFIIALVVCNGFLLASSADARQKPLEFRVGDAASSDYKVVTTDSNGEPLRREQVKSERDSHRNLVKVVNYRWNHGSGDYEPYVVVYHIVKYRE